MYINITPEDDRWYDLEDLPNEVWKDIKDYENLYKISNYGRVKSLERITYCGNRLKPRILKSSINKYGYECIYLTKYAKTKTLSVHRLVGIAFMPNEKNLPEINHKDENKLNNHVDNLEWCTHKYNSSYGTRVARIIPKTIDKTRTEVDQYTLDGKFLKTWYSMNEASRTLGISQQNISKCCYNTRNSAGGYKWCFHRERVIKNGT